MSIYVVVEKREEYLLRGRTSDELVEQYGFTVENSVRVLQSVCAAGFTAHDSDYNALGYSSMGVYLCRHADVCLRHAAVKFSGAPIIRLVVCKVRLVFTLPVYWSRCLPGKIYITVPMFYYCRLSGIGML